LTTNDTQYERTVVRSIMAASSIPVEQPSGPIKKEIEAFRELVCDDIKELGLSQRAFARKVSETGACSGVAVRNWLGGKTKNPGLAMVLGVERVISTLHPNTMAD